MNARNNTPLRTLIAAHLDEAGECTALAIAKAVGKGDVPSVVVKELNAMRTDGQVECEQRKKEVLYWLAVPLAQIAGGTHEAPAAPASDLPPGVREGTRAAQIYRALPEFGAEPMTAREIATATGCAKGLIAPVLTAMDKANQVTRIPAGVEGGVPYGYTRLPPAGSDSEGGEADVKAQSAEIPPPVPPQIPPPQYDPNSVAFSASTDAEQDQQRAHLHLIGVLADIRAAIGDREGRLMQDELVEHIRAIYDLGEAHKRACLAWESAMMAAVGEDGVNDAVKAIDKLRAEASALNQIRAWLLPHVYVGNDEHAPDTIECARRIADRLEIVSGSASLRLDTIAQACETLAEAVDSGEIDTADLDLLEIADLAARNLQDLRNQLESLQREAMRGATCLSGQDRYTAAGYLVRATKRKPRTLQAEDKAREAALSSIRAGAQRAEVFALVPIGHARRGVEWRSA